MVVPEDQIVKCANQICYAVAHHAHILWAEAVAVIVLGIIVAFIIIEK